MIFQKLFTTLFLLFSFISFPIFTNSANAACTSPCTEKSLNVEFTTALGYYDSPECYEVNITENGVLKLGFETMVNGATYAINKNCTTVDSGTEAEDNNFNFIASYDVNSGDHFQFLISNSGSAGTSLTGYYNIEFVFELANDPPVLTSNGYSPSTDGDTDETYTFSVYYDDVDYDDPSKQQIVINDGTPQTMQFTGLGDSYSGEYEIATTLPEGTTNYYYLFSDGVNSDVRSPSTGSHAGPTITRINNPPEFVGFDSPNDGSTASTFTYRVMYSDSDGDPPTTINVILDGNTSAPIPLSLEADQDPSYGWYSANVSGSTLGVGSHTFHFTASDGIDSQTSPEFNAPTVSNPFYDLKTTANSSISPDYASPGDFISVSAYFENLGNAPVSTIPYRIYIQRDMGDSGDLIDRLAYSDLRSIILVNDETGSIGEGDTQSYSHDVRVPETLKPGYDYFVVFEIDPDNTVSDIDLSNNLSYDAILAEYNLREVELGLCEERDSHSIVCGDPVNTALGNFVYSKTDIYLPGPGINFAFKRTYNSQSGVDSPIGAYWNHSYNIFLHKDRVANDSGSTTESGDITIVFGDGRHVKFIYDGTNFAPPLGIDSTLTYNSTDNTYTYTPQNKKRTYTFSYDGTLSAIEDRNGNVMAFTYTDGRLTSITDTAGRTITLSYALHGEKQRIVSIAGPERAAVQYEYDTAGNLTAVIDPERYRTSFTYLANHNDKHLLHSIENGRGIVEVKNYYGLPVGEPDSNGYHVIEQVHADNSSTFYYYDTSNRVTTITGQDGNSIKHYHDQRYRVIKEVDGEGNELIHSFNTEGYKEWVQNKRGYKTFFTYDARGNVLTREEPDGIVTKFEYNVDNTLKSKREDYTGLNLLWSYEHDPATGNLLSVTDPENHKTTYTYTPAGQVETKEDPIGNITSYYYNDAHKNLTRVEDPEGGTISYEYDDAGRKISENDSTDPTLAVSYVYDGNDNIIEIHDSEGIRYFQFDGNSNKKSSTNRRGFTTTYAYDGRDRLITQQDAYGRTVTKTYYPTDIDLVDTKTDQWGNETKYTYNTLGKILTFTNADLQTTTYEYDENGNKTAEIDPEGNRWRYVYDSRDRLIEETDPLMFTTTRTYDRLGRIETITNAKSQTTSFTYTKDGRLKQVVDAEGGSSVFEYDQNGNRISETDARGNTIYYQYDGLNRLVKITDRNTNTTSLSWMNGLNKDIQRTKVDGNFITTTNTLYPDKRRIEQTVYSNGEPGITYTHDGNGNVLTMTDGAGTTTYQYDNLDRILSVNDPFGNTVQYSYDDVNHTKTIVYPDGKEVIYRFDNMNRLSEVADWLGYTTTYTYNTRGLLHSVSNTKGTTTTYLYDIAGRLVTAESRKSDNTLLAAYDMTLDQLGNRTNIAMEAPLVAAPPEAQVSAEYDAENQIYARGDDAYTFDNAGRISTADNSASATSYTFNNQDRLTAIADGNDTSSYLYNGAGDRLASTHNSVQTRYVLNQAADMSQVLCETDEAGNILSYYVHGSGLLYKILPDGTRYQYHFDPLGSTVALTDTTESVTDAYAYGPYGNLLTQQGTTENPFTFVGQYGVMQEETGLYFMRARFYDPSTKRFLSRDPVKGDDKDTQGMSPYLYARSNPVILVDPEGELSSNIMNIVTDVGSIGTAIYESIDKGEVTATDLVQIGGNLTSLGLNVIGVSNPFIGLGIGLGIEGVRFVEGVIDGWTSDYEAKFSGGHTIGAMIGGVSRGSINQILTGSYSSSSSWSDMMEVESGLIGITKKSFSTISDIIEIEKKLESLEENVGDKHDSVGTKVGDKHRSKNTTCSIN